MRYFILRNPETREVYLSLPMEFAPENSVPFFSNDFVRPVFDQYPNPTTIIEGATIEEISLISLEKETAKYIKRRNDGVRAYMTISAEFRLAKVNGIITEEAHAIIEKTLIPVRDEVLAGQWISAKNELVLIGSTVIGNDLYGRLYNQIDNYINENY